MGELAIIPETIPLTKDSDGVLRVKGSRVTLDTIVAAFHEGLTPEEMVQQYASLYLADVFLVLGYYLQHYQEIWTYLDERQQLAQAVRFHNEARFNPDGIRERLLARRHTIEKAAINASTGC